MVFIESGAKKVGLVNMFLGLTMGIQNSITGVRVNEYIGNRLYKSSLMNLANVS